MTEFGKYQELKDKDMRMKKEYHRKLEQVVLYGGVVWWRDGVVWCFMVMLWSFMVAWWCCMVVLYGGVVVLYGVVWWCCMVVLHGGVVWWCCMMVLHGSQAPFQQRGLHATRTFFPPSVR